MQGMEVSERTPVLPALGEAGRFRAREVAIRADQLLRIQGYADPDAVRRPIRRAAERAAAIASEITEGRAAFRRLRVSVLDGERLELDGDHCLRCGAFGRYLAGCESVLVFALTAGAAFDARIETLMREDQPVEGLFLDSAGWVEAVTRQLVDALKCELAERGGAVTRRLGPGYSYRRADGVDTWPLDQQAALFAALDGADVPVTLLESSAMQPKMSRSGLFGLRGVPA